MAARVVIRPKTGPALSASLIQQGLPHRDDHALTVRLPAALGRAHPSLGQSVLAFPRHLLPAEHSPLAAASAVGAASMLGDVLCLLEPAVVSFNAWSPTWEAKYSFVLNGESRHISLKADWAGRVLSFEDH